MFIRYLIYIRHPSKCFDVLTQLDFIATLRGTPHCYHILQVMKLKYQEATNLLKVSF